MLGKFVSDITFVLPGQASSEVECKIISVGDPSSNPEKRQQEF